MISNELSMRTKDNPMFKYNQNWNNTEFIRAQMPLLHFVNQSTIQTAKIILLQQN